MQLAALQYSVSSIKLQWTGYSVSAIKMDNPKVFPYTKLHATMVSRELRAKPPKEFQP